MAERRKGTINTSDELCSMYKNKITFLVVLTCWAERGKETIYTSDEFCSMYKNKRTFLVVLKCWVERGKGTIYTSDELCSMCKKKNLSYGLKVLGWERRKGTMYTSDELCSVCKNKRTFLVVWKCWAERGRRTWPAPRGNIIGASASTKEIVEHKLQFQMKHKWRTLDKKRQTVSGK